MLIPLKSCFTCWSWKVHIWEEKNGYLVRGRPCAFPDHYLLYLPLADLVHGATSRFPRVPCGWRARSTPMADGGGVTGWQHPEAREAARCPQGFTGRLSMTALQTQRLSPTLQKLCPGLDEPCCCTSDPLRGAAGHGPSPPAGSTHMGAAGAAALMC